MERLEAGGIELAYADIGGEGPTVVLVHGLGGTSYAWWGQIAALADAGYRAIAYDQRGSGRSTIAPAPYSIDLWAEDLERLLDGLGVERAGLVGHSVGCMVAERAAARLGERAAALALCGGAIAWPEEARPVFEQRAALARAGRMDEIAEAVAAAGLSERCRRQRPELHGLMLELIASSDPDAYAEAALAAAAGEMRDIGSFACPVLAFAGEHDPVTPPALSEAIAEAAPRGEAAVVPRAAHWCMLEAGRDTNSVLLAFLKRALGG